MVSMGTLVVKREVGRRDGLRDYKIHVDGELLARVAEGRTVSVSLAPGPHVIQLSLDWAKSKKFPAMIEGGKTTTLYCRPSGGRILAPLLKANDYILLQITESTGASDANLHLAKRFGLAYGGAAIFVFVSLTSAVLAGASPTVGGIVVAVSVTLWILACVLTDVPIRWFGHKKRE